MNDQVQEKALSKKDVRKSWIRWLFSNMACYNYERLMGLGFLHSMVPVIDKLYHDKPEEKAAAMKRHLVFFNSEPCFGSPILGLTASMEERRANGADLDDDGINSVKAGLMGPASGLGDTVIQGVIVPLLLAFAIGISKEGNLAGPILYSIVISVIVLLVSFYGYSLGYKKGNAAILEMLESGTINRIVAGASIMGCMVLGALVANYVSLKCAIVIPQGDDVFSFQEGLFDVILPKMLPLALTFGCYKLLEKGLSAIKIIIGMFIVGIAGAFLGIFG